MKPFNFIFLSVIILLPLFSISQQFDIVFQQCYGGSEGDSGADIVLIPDSTFMVLSITYSDDGDISYSHGEHDIWVTKTDWQGILLWENTYGGSDTESPQQIENDPTGGHFLLSYTQSNDGDVSGNHGGIDYWVTKIDDLGNLIWQKCLGSSVNDYASQMSIDDSGNVYIIGQSHGNDGDITSPRGFVDYWIVKINNQGTLIWDRSLGGSNADLGKCILCTSDGGYIAGGLTTSEDGDVTCDNTSLMQSDMWIVKLDSANNIQWQSCYGGSESETAYDIKRTQDDGYIIAGVTKSNDGDVSGFHGVPGENFDIWVLKIDSLGIILWERCFGGTKDDGNPEITISEDGEIIINGYTYSNDGDVSGNHSNEVSPDIWLFKLSSEGDLLWQQCFGSSQGEASSGISQISSIEFMIAGGTCKADGSVECDLFHPGSPSDSDLWLFSIIDTVTVNTNESIIDPFTISMYPNPAHDVMYYHIYPPQDNLTLRLYDIYGQKMNTLVFSDNESQVKVGVANYHPGVYVAVLFSNNRIIDRRQFIVN